MKQLLTDMKAMTLIAGSAAMSLGATALFLSAEPSPKQADCLVDLPELVSSISISSSGGVAVVVPDGDVETMDLCATVEDHGRKRRKRRRHPHADRDVERIQVRVVEARERAEEAAARAREARVRTQEARVRVDEIHLRVEEAMERTEEARRRAIERAMETEWVEQDDIEDAIERAMESVDGQEIEEAIERALESLDEDEIGARIEARMKRLEKRLEKVGNGGN